METRSKELPAEMSPWKKPIGAAIWKTVYQKISNFTAHKPQDNQHEIRIAFLERDKPEKQKIILVSNEIKKKKPV